MGDMHRDLIKPDEFEEVMARLVTRAGKTRGIAYASLVEGKQASAVAVEFGCTEQNIYKALVRFSKAHDLLQEFRRNTAPHDAVPASPPLL